MGVVPFLQRELANIGITMNAGKTVALLPKGHIPTPEEIIFLEALTSASRTGVE